MGQMFFPDDDGDSKGWWNIDKIPWWILIAINIVGILLNLVVWLFV